MSDLRHIKSALISVFHKDGLEPIVGELKRLGVTIYSTGGTQAAIEAMGAEVVPVESVTDYPSILGGRVKTLHPKVFGGILNRRNHEGDQAQMAEYNLPNIDLVVVDLYPFEATVASGASEADIVEKSTSEASPSFAARPRTSTTWSSCPRWTTTAPLWTS